VNEKLAWYPLRAPFEGTVIEKHLALGEKHGDESDVFTIADLSSVWVDISVYQKDLPSVKKGQSVRISAGEGTPSTLGTISFVAPIVDEKTRTALARVVLPNPQGEWRPGLFVTAELSVGDETAPVVISKTAMQRVAGDTVVFIEMDGGLEPVPVRVGRTNTTHAEILSGLQSGQRYVAEGAFELKAKIVTSGLGAHAGHGH
jgi:cobalt-zinc-cadmium efflux system membrane fusion protein